MSWHRVEALCFNVFKVSCIPLSIVLGDNFWIVLGDNFWDDKSANLGNILAYL